MILWRIAADTRAYPADDMTGNGARATGGRWNAEGHAVVYTSTSRALACLETVVHLNAGGLPLNRYLIEISVPEALWKAARRVEKPPVGWDAQPASMTSVDLGTAWLRAGKAALLVVPSVIVPEEMNVLINPALATGIKARKARRWLYDGRLKETPHG
ncbi:RES domain-containing protein [Rhodovarius crocodyli]|uniref:RES domain-containing protein n=1 Tax=Rhodovarius crocodyli TaxID=1979269 RepID=A0A437MG48_9PROT|nr:RES family NAD+ phosphorylase [Rhodovarius crocodyli]RVT96636.1 RES domain-containing protein [Rhodovarius crocodyli]